MKIVKYVLVGLLVMSFGTTVAFCEDFSSPDFGDINVVDGDSLEADAGWDDIVINGDYAAVKASVMSVDAGDGTLDEEALVALLSEIERRLLGGQSLTGEMIIDGREVVLSTELLRQQKIWEEASKRFLVSPEPSEGLSSITDTDFVDNAGIDSDEFNSLFSSVIDSDTLAHKELAGEKMVTCEDYSKVANLYKALADDIFSYNSSMFLAGNSSDFEVTSKAKASAGIIEQRMKNYVDTLKRVLIKG
jgi:hypothetical protein